MDSFAANGAETNEKQHGEDYRVRMDQVGMVLQVDHFLIVGGNVRESPGATTADPTTRNSSTPAASRRAGQTGRAPRKSRCK